MVFRRTKRFAKRALKLPFTTGRYAYRGAAGFNKAMATATAAYYGVKKLQGLVNSEMFHNQGTGSTTIPNTGIITLLNGMAQNDTSSGRTGNSILMRNVMFRAIFTQNATAVATQLRAMIILDTQQVSDNSPVLSDILESINVVSPLSTASAGRFKVMKSWIFTLDDTKSQTKVIDYYKQFRFHTRYNGTSGTDIQKNGLYLVLLSDQSINVPTINYTWKVGYHDN